MDMGITSLGGVTHEPGRINECNWWDWTGNCHIAKGSSQKRRLAIKNTIIIESPGMVSV